MSASSLPERPDLDQLRRRAKELRNAARSGESEVLARFGDLPITLASAQLLLAREYGFASWARLKTDIQARTMTPAQHVEAFLAASVTARTGRAAQLLADHPGIAAHDIRAAVVLGEAAQVAERLERDPGLAAWRDERTGWTLLLGVCNSRWHRIDPARSEGMVAVARLLLDAGADPNASAGNPGERGHCSPLYAAAGLAAHPALAALLLERGADPDTHAALYHTAFHHDDHACLRLLLEHGARAEGLATLGAAISVNDAEAVRLLLDAGIDGGVPVPADSLAAVDPDTPPIPPVCAAIEHQCGIELIEVLLQRGADPDAAQQEGRSPLRMALRRGRDDLVDLLTRYGARDDATSADRFLDACLRADRVQAYRLRLPVDALGADGLSALVQAAERGQTAAVALMFDLGFPLDARDDGSDGATALHAAASSGSPATVRLLLDRGAGIEARDTTWGATPLVWASVGSGFRMGHAPAPDWVATVQALIDAGADLDGTWVEGKPPSEQVGALLRAHGVEPPGTQEA